MDKQTSLTPLQTKIKQSMIDKWPSGVVYRMNFAKFSDNLLNAKTMANLDCDGKGIEDRISSGSKVAYLLESAAEFVARRMTAELHPGKVGIKSKVALKS